MIALVTLTRTTNSFTVSCATASDNGVMGFARIFALSVSAVN